MGVLWYEVRHAIELPSGEDFEDLDLPGLAPLPRPPVSPEPAFRPNQTF